MNETDLLRLYLNKVIVNKILKMAIFAQELKYISAPINRGNSKKIYGLIN